MVSMEELYHESSQVNLLVSLLLRFPVLSTVHYDPAFNKLKMIIFLKELAEDKFKSLCEIINEHLASHNRLLSRINDSVKLEMKKEADLASIVIWHEINLAFCQETTIILKLIEEHLAPVLITEGNQFLDELLISGEDLEELVAVAKTQNATNKTKLTGLRSDGKVLVYSDRHQKRNS